MSTAIHVNPVFGMGALGRRSACTGVSDGVGGPSSWRVGTREGRVAPGPTDRELERSGGRRAESANLLARLRHPFFFVCVSACARIDVDRPTWINPRRSFFRNCSRIMMQC